MKFTYVTQKMRHLDFFGLSSNPFPVVPDDEAFYCSDHIEQIISEIVYGITTGKGFMVLTGEVGLGKTTIARRIVNLLEQDGIETSLVLQTACQGADLLMEIIRDFGIDTQTTVKKEPGFGDHINYLREFLVSQNQQGKNCAIIVDDAQNLNQESLELIRMISNLETSRQKLVQILLVGQPELIATLNETSLRQLKSRIIVRQEAKPMTRPELKHYVEFKLNRAGNTGLVTVDPSAIKTIYKRTRGNFRHSNILLDRCLHVAYLQDTTHLTKGIVSLANEDLEGKQRMLTKKVVALGLSSVLLLVLAGAVHLYDLNLYHLFKSSGESQSRPHEAGVAQVNVLPLITGSDAENLPLQDAADHTSPPSGAISKFLEAYDLSRFEESFSTAVKSNQLENTARSIFQQTGYQLVQLAEVPDRLRAQYGILSYPLPGGDQGDSHYLFWKPLFSLDTYYYAYKGQEIYALQERMAQINLYSAALDGVVGRNLMKGIVAFQQQAGLPITGYPDATTIFLLCHFEGKN
jgi:general secretion pathway protein A